MYIFRICKKVKKKAKCVKDDDDDDVVINPLGFNAGHFFILFTLFYNKITVCKLVSCKDDSQCFLP